MEFDYAFVRFSSEVSFWGAGKKGQVFQSVGGSLCPLYSLSQE